MKVPLKKLHSGAAVPAPSTIDAAGVDLCALNNGILRSGDTAIVDTGLAIAIPAGYVGLICSRSGLAAKHSVFVLNAPGIIDADYRGEIKVILSNANLSDFSWNAGDRLAQLVLVRYEPTMFQEVAELSGTARGAGGLGSTGMASLPPQVAAPVAVLEEMPTPPPLIEEVL